MHNTPTDSAILFEALLADIFAVVKFLIGIFTTILPLAVKYLADIFVTTILPAAKQLAALIAPLGVGAWAFVVGLTDRVLHNLPDIAVIAAVAFTFLALRNLVLRNNDGDVAASGKRVGNVPPKGVKIQAKPKEQHW